MIRYFATPISMMYHPNHCTNAFGFGNTRAGDDSGDRANSPSLRPSYRSAKPESADFDLISADIFASVAGWINLEPSTLSRGCSD